MWDVNYVWKVFLQLYSKQRITLKFNNIVEGVLKSRFWGFASSLAILRSIPLKFVLSVSTLCIIFRDLFYV